MPDGDRRFSVGDAARAVVELAIARIGLDKSWSRETLAEPEKAPQELDPPKRNLVARVSFIVPRVAARVPWRADCMVQALAARRWLDRAGIATTINLGAPKDKSVPFAAHAWLKAGDMIVTGGDVSRFAPFER